MSSNQGSVGTEASPHWLSPLSLHFVLPFGVEDIAAASLGTLGSDMVHIEGHWCYLCSVCPAGTSVISGEGGQTMKNHENAKEGELRGHQIPAPSSHRELKPSSEEGSLAHDSKVRGKFLWTLR